MLVHRSADRSRFAFRIGCRALGAAWMLCAASAGALRADETLAILPGEVTFSGSEARQQLVVENVRSGRHAGQIDPKQVVFETSNPQVVRVGNGVAVPVGNGEAVITAKVGDRVATSRVKVAGLEAPHRWSFRNHVQSVFSKSGCNSGACHGAAAGKNGFKLSLRGYDPEFDYYSITRQSSGRRIVPK